MAIVGMTNTHSVLFVRTNNLIARFLVLIVVIIIFSFVIVLLEVVHFILVLHLVPVREEEREAVFKLFYIIEANLFDDMQDRLFLFCW